MWSEELELWLGPWKGVYLTQNRDWIRFFTKAGRLVPTHAEAEAQKSARQAARADQEAARAEQAVARAEQEAAGRAAAEAEIAKLRQELAQSRGKNGKQ